MRGSLVRLLVVSRRKKNERISKGVVRKVN